MARPHALLMMLTLLAVGCHVQQQADRGAAPEDSAPDSAAPDSEAASEAPEAAADAGEDPPESVAELTPPPPADADDEQAAADVPLAAADASTEEASPLAADAPDRSSAGGMSQPFSLSPTRSAPRSRDVLPRMAPRAPSSANSVAAEEPAAPNSTPLNSAAAAAADPPPEAAVPGTSGPGLASDLDRPSSVVRNEDDYAVMQVFYATNRDRLRGDTSSLAWLPFCVALAGGALTVGFFIESGGRRRSRRAWLPSFTLCLTIVLTAYTAFNQRGGGYDQVAYSADRGPLQYGLAEVSIPNVHVPGELESPSILRLEFSARADKHIVIQDLSPQSPEDFFDLVRDASTEEKSLLVFVHGYNVRFNEALLRTAQLAFDLKFQGAPILFSWPSYGGLLKYPMDLSNADWSTTHFKQFLLDLRERTGASSINLIAHSMGNRVLMEALSELTLEHGGNARMFDEIIMAAPDVDADRFHDLAPRVIATADRTTLYASSRDQALMISKRFNGAPRAGDSGEQLVLVSGIDTIDASYIDTSMLGHSYYGDNDAILRDLRAILQLAQEPMQRRWLAPKQRSGLTYWVFRNDVLQAESDEADLR